MDQVYCSYGNPFEIKLKKHYCYRCGGKLSIIKDSRVIYPKSEEAKYYPLGGMDDSALVGPCEFVFDVYFCPMCLNLIEIDTQLSLEECDRLPERVGKYCFKKGIKVTKIRGYFETCDGRTVEKVENGEKIQDIWNFRIQAFNDDECILDYKALLVRKSHNTRLYYFDISWLRVKGLLKRIK